MQPCQLKAQVPRSSLQRNAVPNQPLILGMTVVAVSTSHVARWAAIPRLQHIRTSGIKQQSLHSAFLLSLSRNNGGQGFEDFDQGTSVLVGGDDCRLQLIGS
jgi:hypothetical protein